MGLSTGIGIGIGFNRGSESWGNYWASKDWGNYNAGLEKSLCSADALINEAQPTYNYGTTVVFAAGEYNSAATKTRSCIKFDLSAIPDGADITSAILSLTINSDLSDNARALKVYRLKKAFVEGSGSGAASGDGVTWNTRNGTDNWTTAGAFDAADCEQAAIGSVTFNSAEAVGSVKNITLTASVKSDLDLGFGFLLKMDTETNDAYTFRYRLNETDYPYLTIKWKSLINGTVSSLLTKNESDPLFEGAFGSIVYEGVGQYSYYYCKVTDRYIYKRSSTDGLTWGAESTVLDGGVGKKVEVASAWKEGAVWYMLFRSDEWGGSKAIGLATSIDGTTWTKEATNPIITNTDIGAWCTGDIDPWGIIKVGVTYYLWVNDVAEVPRQSGLMTSTDLINWTADANNPIFDNERYCAAVIKYNGNYYMFMCYTPTGNVVGANPWAYRIELYRDSDPRFLSTSREYLGVVLLGGANTEWDDDYLDTPSIITETIQRDTFPLGIAENGKLWMYYTGHSGTVWAHGLAVGHLEMLAQLTTLTEPGAGE
jgi:hypothetical protein